MKRLYYWIKEQLQKKAISLRPLPYLTGEIIGKIHYKKEL